METITKTYKVYEFDELDPKTRERVVDKFRDINTDYYWSEVTIWDQKDELKKFGFDAVEIYFTGFWSQGDGACFVGNLDNEGLLKFLTESKELSKYPRLVRAIKNDTIYVNIKITHTDRYCHENSTTIADYTEMQDNSELSGKLLEDYTKWYESFDARGPQNESIGWYYDKCREFYSQLQDEYDFRTNDDSVIDTIRANEYQFLEDGTLF